MEIMQPLCETFLNVTLKPVYYKDNLATGKSSSAQAVISEQIRPGRFDSYMGLFWTRIGTPTETHKSGTLEELDIAIDRMAAGHGMGIHVYFSEAIPSSYEQVLCAQGAQISELRKELGSKGIFYKTFSSVLELQRMVSHDIKYDLNQDLPPRHTTPTGEEPIDPPPTSSFNARDLLSEGRAKEFGERITQYFGRLTALISTTAGAMNTFNKQMRDHTAYLSEMKENGMPESELLKERDIVLGKLASESQEMNTAFLALLEGGPRTGYKAIAEIDAFLEITGPLRPVAYTLFLASSLKKFHGTTEFALRSFMGFRATMTGMETYRNNFYAARSELVITMGKVEDFLVQLIIETDGLAVRSSL